MGIITWFPGHSTTFNSHETECHFGRLPVEVNVLIVEQVALLENDKPSERLFQWHHGRHTETQAKSWNGMPLLRLSETCKEMKLLCQDAMFKRITYDFHPGKIRNNGTGIDYMKINQVSGWYGRAKIHGVSEVVMHLYYCSDSACSRCRQELINKPRSASLPRQYWTFVQQLFTDSSMLWYLTALWDLMDRWSLDFQGWYRTWGYLETLDTSKWTLHRKLALSTCLKATPFENVKTLTLRLSHGRIAGWTDSGMLEIADVANLNNLLDGIRLPTDQGLRAFCSRLLDIFPVLTNVQVERESLRCPKAQESNGWSELVDGMCEEMDTKFVRVMENMIVLRQKREDQWRQELLVEEPSV